MAGERDLKPDFRAFARRMGIVVAAIGAIGLAGWILDLSQFKRLVPGLGAMAPNSSVALLALGIALVFGAGTSSRSRRARAFSLAAILVFLLGAVTCAEYLTRRSWGIDQLLFRDIAGEVITDFPGRMAVSAAVCFVLLGAALILLGGRFPVRGQILAGLSGLISLVAIAGLVYEIPALYSVGFFRGIAANTAIALTLASFGAVCLRPDAGISAAAAGPTASGFMLRRLGTLALVTPLLIGWLQTLGENAGLYPKEFGDALFTIAMTIAAFGLIGWNSRVLARIERARQRDAEAIGRLAAIVESSDDGILATDLDGRITAWNCGAERIYGYTAAEVGGQSLGMLSPADRAEEQRGVFRRVRSGESVEFLETVRRRKNGHPVSLSITVSPIRGERRAIVGTCAIFRDVTEVRRAQQALQESEERYRNLFLSAHDIVFTLGLDGRFTSVNPAAERVFGYSLREAVELTFEDVVPPEDRARIQQLFAGRTAGDTSPAAREFDIFARDGRRISVEVSTQPVFRDDRVVGVQGIGRDISERKEVEARLRKVERAAALGSLIAGVAHEVRNPLFAISATVEAFCLRTTASNDLRALSDALEPSVRRLNDLMNGLIDYARPSVRDREIPIGEILDVVSADASELSRAKGISVTIERCPGTDLRIRADLRRIRQAFRSVVENAVRQERSGGCLHIDARIAGSPGEEVVRCSVEDGGPGFSASALRRAFDPFYTERTSAAGLGLAIARRIVEDHGGRIAVENRPGGGARVVVELPAANRGRSTANRPTDPSEASGLPAGVEILAAV